MADEEVKDAVEVPKSPAELAAEVKAADELRRKNQTEFDPKVHGVGTTPVMEPESVKELFKYVRKLEARIASLEGRFAPRRAQ